MTTNNERRARALAAIDAHAAASDDTREGLRARMIDLVTDLRHLADVHDVRFSDVVLLSAQHHTEERRQ